MDAALQDVIRILCQRYYCIEHIVVKMIEVFPISCCLLSDCITKNANFIYRGTTTKAVIISSI